MVLDKPQTLIGYDFGDAWLITSNNRSTDKRHFEKESDVASVAVQQSNKQSALQHDNDD